MFEFLADSGVQRGINQAILLAALVTARLVPIIQLVPYLGGQMVNQTVKMGLSLALTIMVYPSVWASGAASELPEDPLTISLLVAKEALIGVTIGFVAALVFDAMRMAGRLVDTARGQTKSTTMNPQLKTQASISGDFLYQLGVVIFLLTGGHRLFIGALVKSYSIVPPQHFIELGDSHAAIAYSVLRLFADSIGLAVLLAFPVITAILLTDMTLALINKAAPQINVFFLGMPIKACLGVAVIFFALDVIIQKFLVEAGNSIEHVWNLLYLLGGHP